MGNPKMNGIELREGEYLKDQTKGTMSMMLGANGLPKYTQAQLSSITKAKLFAELQPIYEQLLYAEPIKIKKPQQKRGAKRRPAKNKHSAQSKKCHLIEDICDGKLTLLEVEEIYVDDYWLRQCCTWDELKNTFETKVRPGSKRKVTIVDVDPASGYIIARARGE